MSTDELFQLFGGRQAVMTITGAKRNAVNGWRYTGIPYKHWPILIRAAQESGIGGIDFDSLQSTRLSAGAA